MGLPQISVIIPVFYTAKYLRKCLDSILEQTFQNFEVILISEGLDDDDNICREYVQQDKRIFLYRNPYKGLGGARNRGLELARGEFISFIDSDDWVEKVFLEKMLVGVNQGADIVQCGTNIVFEDKACLKQKVCDEKYFAINRKGVVFVKNDIFGSINVGSWNKLYRKSLIEKYSLRFPEQKRNEDAYFSWAYWAISEKMYCIPDKLYNYLRRKESLMAQTFSKRLGKAVLDHLEIGEYFYKFLVENGLFERRMEAFFKAFTVCYFFVRDNADTVYKEIGHNRAKEFLSKVFIPEEYVLLRRIAKCSFSEFSLDEKNTFSENLLSLKDSYDKKHKILTLLGVKLKMKVRQKR